MPARASATRCWAGWHGRPDIRPGAQPPPALTASRQSSDSPWRSCRTGKRWWTPATRCLTRLCPPSAVPIERTPDGDGGCHGRRRRKELVAARSAVLLCRLVVAVCPPGSRPGAFGRPRVRRWLARPSSVVHRAKTNHSVSSLGRRPAGAQIRSARCICPFQTTVGPVPPWQPQP